MYKIIILNVINRTVIINYLNGAKTKLQLIFMIKISRDKFKVGLCKKKIWLNSLHMEHIARETICITIYGTSCVHKDKLINN